MKKINAGIIGIGHIGGAHIEAIKRLGYPNIAAVVVRNEAKAKEICENFGIPKYFTHYQEMLADSSTEVIHNCTPNKAHFQINKDVILSGKHILSEKPLTINSSESQELVKLTQKYKVLNAVNFVYRHYDTECVLKMAEQCGAVVTVEEHSIIGGLGSAVAEVLAGHSGAKFVRVGIQDKFGKSGKPRDLFAAYGLTAENIVAQSKSLIK